MVATPTRSVLYYLLVIVLWSFGHLFGALALPLGYELYLEPLRLRAGPGPLRRRAMRAPVTPVINQPSALAQ